MADFWVALPLPKKLQDEIEVHGIRGRIVEQITHDEYLAVWAAFQDKGVGSLNPRAYYRCERLDS